MKFSSARLGQLIALSGAVLIASMTLVPHPELTKESARTPLSCLLCGDYGIVDVFLNILLFIPFGFGLRLAGVSRFRGQALLMATSLGIELLQMNVIMGRDASLSDFLTNSLGGGLGIWMADHWSDFVFPSPARARRLRIPAALGWLAVWVASAWLVEPSMPPTALVRSAGRRGRPARQLQGSTAHGKGQREGDTIRPTECGGFGRAPRQLRGGIGGGQGDGGGGSRHPIPGTHREHLRPGQL